MVLVISTCVKHTRTESTRFFYFCMNSLFSQAFAPVWSDITPSSDINNSIFQFSRILLVISILGVVFRRTIHSLDGVVSLNTAIR